MESLYQELIHIPLIVRLPGGRLGGTRVDSPVSVVDLVPSMLDLLDLPAAEDVSGHSFVPLLEGKSRGPRRGLVSELTHASGNEYRSVIRFPWKYIHHLQADTGELYNLAQDPDELRELAAAEPERTREMRQWLSRWSAEHGPRWTELETAKFGPEEVLKLRALGYLGAD